MAFAPVKLQKVPPSRAALPGLASGRCPVYVRRLPPCRKACPSHEDIRGYLTALTQRELSGRSVETSLDEAWHLLTDRNPFPAVCGRICPHPCESACNRGDHDESVAIHRVERRIGDHGLARGLRLRKLTERRRQERIAVIGAGPAGLSCACQLARRGYPVTVFEAAAEPGGMLRYGIPPYRLPKDVLAGEIRAILALGVGLVCGTRIGGELSFAKLRSRHAAVFVALGAQRALRLGIAGEDSPGVLDAVDFLRRTASGERPPIGGEVVVIGGGNTAVDAARVSRRLGARATVLYRRERGEMPAAASEVSEAESEGVSFNFLAAPGRIGAGASGRLRLECLQMQAGPLDPGGRHRPVPIPDSAFALEADTVIAAVGQEADLTGLEDAGPAPGIFLGGDLVHKDFAVAAIGAGRRAALAIDAYLNGLEFREPQPPRPVRSPELQLNYYESRPRLREGELPAAARVAFFAEVNLGLSAQEALAEAARCLSCGLCFVCDRCRVFCPARAIGRDPRRPQGQVMFTDYTRCIGCEVCAAICPCHYIEMGLDWTRGPLPG